MEKVPCIFSLSSDIQYSHDSIHKQQFLESAQKTIFWGNEPLSAQFWSELSLLPLFSTQRYIVLRHTEKITKEDFNTISSYCKNIDSTLCVVFCIESEICPKHIQESLLYKEAQKNNAVYIATALTRKNIAQHIVQYAKSKNITIEHNALQYLKEILPLSSSAIHNEIDKLALASTTATIPYSLVQEASGYTQEYTIWELFNALFNKQSLRIFWEKVLHEISFFSFSAILQKELRTFACILAGESVSLSPYMRTRKEELAKQLSLEKIGTLLHILLQAEYNIKSGNSTEKQMLEYVFSIVPKTL